jgi:hypothetical protein
VLLKIMSAIEVEQLKDVGLVISGNSHLQDELLVRSVLLPVDIYIVIILILF